MFLAFSSLASDLRPRALDELSLLAGAGAEHRAAQLFAYSSAQVLTEGLRRTGRHLSKERLPGSLEGIYAFATGLTPPLTFGPSRRIGALGAYIVTVDRRQMRFRPVGGWSALPERGPKQPEGQRKGSLRNRLRR